MGTRSLHKWKIVSIHKNDFPREEEECIHLLWGYFQETASATINVNVIIINLSSIPNSTNIHRESLFEFVLWQNIVEICTERS